MFCLNESRKETLGLILLLTAAGLQCSDSWAMGKKQRSENVPPSIPDDIVIVEPLPAVTLTPLPIPTVPPILVTPSPLPAPSPVALPTPSPTPIPTSGGGNAGGGSSGNVIVGSFQQGYELGKRNGEIISDRLKDRTVGVDGCAGIPKLQDALVSVTKTVRPPVISADDPAANDAVVRGFYQGYIDAVRENIRETRQICDRSAFNSGDFAGNLYGSVLCQVTKVSVETAMALELDALYGGWSGGSDDVVSECRTAAEIIIKDCGGNSLSHKLTINVEHSCSDRGA